LKKEIRGGGGVIGGRRKGLEGGRR